MGIFLGTDGQTCRPSSLAILQYRCFVETAAVGCEVVVAVGAPLTVAVLCNVVELLAAANDTAVFVDVAVDVAAASPPRTCSGMYCGIL